MRHFVPMPLIKRTRSGAALAMLLALLVLLYTLSIGPVTAFWVWEGGRCNRERLRIAERAYTPLCVVGGLSKVTDKALAAWVTGWVEWRQEHFPPDDYDVPFRDLGW
jgi:hypothetical protein